MKYFLLLLLPFFLIGCYDQKLIPKQTIITGYDFSKYANEGFLFTTDIYRGEYDGMGLLQLTSYPEAHLMDTEEFKERKLKNDGNIQGNLFIEYFSVNEALDSLCKHARKMGADAVVKLKITELYYFYSFYKIPYYVVEGFAIRRKPWRMNLSNGEE